MKTMRSIGTSSILVLFLLVMACGGPAEDAATREPEARDEPAATSEADPAASGMAYEPAYPTEVSDEDLSDEDAAQQEATHSHGGEEHSHAEGDDHLHGEDDGEHDHGDGGDDDHRH